MIRVFLGTKAQYIKTAPLLRLMQERDVQYRLIDSGQHGAFSRSLRSELGIKDPEVYLGGKVDIATIPAAVAWSARLAARWLRKRRLIDEVFGPEPGVCVVHGDTPSTFLGALLAKRSGLRVAQLEAGLRSFNVFNPFPEELVRMAVMRRADHLFAESASAYHLLHNMGLAERAILLPANTIVESVLYSCGGRLPEPGSGPAIATMHRLEALTNTTRVRDFLTVLCEAARSTETRLVLHPPTRIALESLRAFPALEASGVDVVDLLSHSAFVRGVAAAPFVITDGGSVQEECSLLGIPTLLWRKTTERPHDLGQNAVLANYDVEMARQFLAQYRRYRLDPSDLTIRPSETVLETLLASVATS